jgi:hypothetical protein
MEICAHYRKPNTSKSEPVNKIYPYLLRQVKVERPMLAPRCIRKRAINYPQSRHSMIFTH